MPAKPEPEPSPLEGKQAPAFNLAGSDGASHALKDYQGKTVVIYFYPKDATPGCTKQACAFRDFNADLLAMGVVVFGVSADSIASHEKFVAKQKLNFVLLSDEDKKMIEAYGAWGEKSMYGKKYMGIIRSTVVVGPDGKVLKHWPKVRGAAKHPAEVVEFLQAE